MFLRNLDKNILQCNTNALKRNLDKHIFAMQHTPSPPRGLPSLLQILRRRPRSESQLQLEASRPSDMTTDQDPRSFIFLFQFLYFLEGSRLSDLTVVSRPTI